MDFGNVGLLIAVLGGNEERGASDQLVVLPVHQPLRAVPVKEIDCEKERLGEEREGSMGLNEEVDEVRPHEPLDVGLCVNERSIGQSFILVTISGSDDGNALDAQTCLHTPPVLGDVLQIFVAYQP